MGAVVVTQNQSMSIAAELPPNQAEGVIVVH